MKRKYLEPALLGIILMGIVALAAYPYLKRSSDAPIESKDKGYSTKLKELRDRFNQDRGKVRLLLLLSPT